MPGDLVVDLLCLGLPTDSLPQAGAVVEVVGDDGAVPLSGGDRLDDGLGGGLGQSGEDPTGV